MLTSTVKWFDAEKGYGFLHHPEGGDDVFVHYSNIQSNDDFKTLQSGQQVEFEMNDGPKGLYALNVMEAEAETAKGDASTVASTDIGPADVDPTAEVDPLSFDDESSTSGV